MSTEHQGFSYQNRAMDATESGIVAIWMVVMAVLPRFFRSSKYLSSRMNSFFDLLVDFDRRRIF
jgi:hypothetical protein